MRIKGNFLKDYVAVVNATPDLAWNRYLTPEDWKVVQSIIVPSMWYPVEVMAHIGRGIFEMRSGKNYSVVRAAGRARATLAYDETAKNFLLKNNPGEALKAYAMIAKRYVDELNVEVLMIGSGRAEVLFHPIDDAPAWDLFREIQAGTMEKLVEMNGGLEPNAVFERREKDGREACLVVLTWK